MKILVTGATGFIGKDLCEKLLNEGHQIHYLTTSKTKLINKKNYEGFLWDPAKTELDTASLKEVDAIINLAGHTINCKWNKANKALILNSRIDSSNTLFKTLKENQHQVKYILNVSAIGIYRSSYGNCYDESNTNYGTDFLADVCKQWETANQRFEQLGIKTSIARLGLVLSKDGGVLYELDKVVSKGLGACLGNGKQWMSWIHKDDVIGAMAFLLNQQKSGIYNIVAPQPLHQKAFLEQLAKTKNRRIWLPNIPPSIIKLILGERAALVLSSQQVSSLKLEQNGYTFQFKDLKSTLEAIYS